MAHSKLSNVWVFPFWMTWKVLSYSLPQVSQLGMAAPLRLPWRYEAQSAGAVSVPGRLASLTWRRWVYPGSADECGSMNEWLAIAPRAQLALRNAMKGR